MSKVSSTSIKEYSSNFGNGSNFSDSVPLSDLPDNVSLSMSVDDANIQSVPKEVLERIWGKAKRLINTPGQVVEGPCFSSTGAKCCVVASKSTDRPHIIQSNKSGQFSCESTCPMW